MLDTCRVCIRKMIELSDGAISVFDGGFGIAKEDRYLCVGLRCVRSVWLWIAETILTISEISYQDSGDSLLN